MKKFNIGLSVAVIALVFTLGLNNQPTVFAATSPSIGASASYAILSSTYTNTTAGTTINGDVGFTTGPAVLPGGSHTNYGVGAPYAVAGSDQNSILSTLNSQGCDFSFGTATDLSTLTQPLTAGVYCVTGAQSIGTGGITLGSGTYIFRSTGALNTVANSQVSGGSACNVFWTPTATTLGANSTFLGTDIDSAGITVGSTVTWIGRALAFGGTVTTNTDTITAPSCGSQIVTPPPIVTPIVTPTPIVNPTPVVAPTVIPTINPTPILAVVSPKLPQTGFPPKENNTPWNIIIPAGMFVIVSTLYITRKRKLI